MKKMKIAKNELKRMINESVGMQLNKVDNEKHNISESIDLSKNIWGKPLSIKIIEATLKQAFKNEPFKIIIDKVNGGLIVKLLNLEMNLYIIRNSIIGITEGNNSTMFRKIPKRFTDIKKFAKQIELYDFEKNPLTPVKKLINNYLDNGNLKYYLSYNNFKKINGHIVFKIKYNSKVSSNNGGYAESEYNFNQYDKSLIFDDATVFDKGRVYGNCQLSGKAMVYDSAEVYDNADVYGNVKIYESAKVYGDAQVYDNAKVYGNVKIYGNSSVYDNAELFGNAEVYDYAKAFNNVAVFGDARVYGNAKVFDDVEVFKNATVFDNAQVYDQSKIFDNAEISGKAQIFGKAQIYESAKVSGDSEISDNAKVYGNVKILDSSINNNVKIYDNAEITESSINDTSKIYGNAKIYDNVEITGYSEIYGDAQIYNECVVDNSEIYGTSEIYYAVTIKDDSEIIDSEIEHAYIINCYVQDSTLTKNPGEEYISQSIIDGTPEDNEEDFH